jgi:hypothetical protein
MAHDDDRTHDGDQKLDDQATREAVENAEPARGTRQWAEMIINQRYEPLISGPGADITKVYDLPYLEAAAITSLEDSGYYERLRQKLKARGVRVLAWEKDVRDTARRIKSEQRNEAQAATTPNPPGAAKPRRSQATQLVKLAMDAGVTLFHDGDAGFATIPADAHAETHALRSKTVRRWLIQLYYSQGQSAPNNEAIAGAINVLDAQACFDGPQIETYMRLASIDEKVYLDLADPGWRQVEIDRDGWRVIGAQQSPARFRRPPGMLALPTPVSGGEIDELRNYLT